MVQFVTPSVFSPCEDLLSCQRCFFLGWERPTGRTDLVAAGEFARMHPLPLLGFADSVRGGGVCDGQRNVAHDVRRLARAVVCWGQAGDRVRSRRSWSSQVAMRLLLVGGQDGTAVRH